MSRPTLSGFIILILAAMIVTSPAAAQRRRAANRAPQTPPAWSAPPCATVTGLPSVRFVSGGVVAKNANRAVNLSAWSVVPGEAPNVLYATLLNQVFKSRDAGCSWSLAGLLPGGDALWKLVVGKTLVYAYNQGSMGLARITSASIEPLQLREHLVRVAVDPTDDLHLRAIAVYGNIHESRDGGETWTVVGDVTEWLVNSGAFDPSDFDHILAAVTGWAATHISYDGGRTWTGRSLDGVKVWEMEFSTVDSMIVWAQGEDVLFRSFDGGRSFSPVLQSRAGLQFTRASIAPHSSDPNIVALESSNGVAIYDHGLGTASIIALGHATTLSWSPAGVLYFAAADEVHISN